MKKLLIATGLVAVLAVSSQAQLSMTTLDVTQTITFDATVAGVSNGQFSGAGFQSAPTAGQLDSDAWAVTGMSDGALAFGGTATSGDLARGNVTTAQTTGGLYAFGSLDRQLMIQPVATDWAPGTLTLKIQNNTGVSVSNWTLAYDLFVRNDQGRASSFNFSYSLDDSTYSTTGLNSALFTYTSVEAAGTLGWQNLGTPSNTIAATVANSDFLYVRWSGADVSGSGSRDEFGIDNIAITATNVPEPGTVLFALLGGAALFLRRRRSA